MNQAFRLLSLLMLLCLLPALALAAKPAVLYVNGVDMLSQAHIACGTGSADYDRQTNTLTLSNARIDTPYISGANAYGIYADGDLTVRLLGASAISTQDGIKTTGSLSLFGASDSASMRIRNTNATLGAAIDSDASLILRDFALDVHSFGFGVVADQDIDVASAALNVYSEFTAGLGLCSLGGTITITDHASIYSYTPGGWGYAIGAPYVIIEDSTVHAQALHGFAVQVYETLTLSGDVDFIVQEGQTSLYAKKLTLNPTSHALDVLVGSKASDAVHYAASPYESKTDLPLTTGSQAIGTHDYVRIRSHQHVGDPCALCGYSAPALPQTGDSSRLTLWLSLLALSCAALGIGRKRVRA